MEQCLTMDYTFSELDQNELLEINGGFSIIILGVTFVGWKAVALVAAGVTTLAGAVALGLWNGYMDTKK